jgi:hypothetical protein
MFRRVVIDSWHDWAPYAAFAITFTVFVVAFVRTLLMRKDRADALARLPLDDGGSVRQPEDGKH